MLLEDVEVNLQLRPTALKKLLSVQEGEYASPVTDGALSCNWCPQEQWATTQLLNQPNPDLHVHNLLDTKLVSFYVYSYVDSVMLDGSKNCIVRSWCYYCAYEFFLTHQILQNSFGALLGKCQSHNLENQNLKMTNFTWWRLDIWRWREFSTSASEFITRFTWWPISGLMDSLLFTSTPYCGLVG